MSFIKEVMQTLSFSKEELWNYNKEGLKEFISLKGRINEISPPSVSFYRTGITGYSRFLSDLLVYPDPAVPGEYLPYFYLYILKLLN